MCGIQGGRYALANCSAVWFVAGGCEEGVGFKIVTNKSPKLLIFSRRLPKMFDVLKTIKLT